jgi:hypothetical protein
MRFDIDEKFFIETDGYNFNLMQKSTVQKGENAGKEYASAHGHYSRLDTALAAYARHSMHVSTADGVKKVCSRLERIEEAIRTVGKEFIAKFPPPTAKRAKGKDD